MNDLGMVGDRSILDRLLRRRPGNGANADFREFARAIDTRAGCESLALIAWTAHLNLAGNHPGAFVARSLIDIAALDVRIQEQVAKYGSLKDFKIVVWRQELDALNCNWNARIERFQGDSNESSWWHIVPLMRERFNLA